MASDAGAWQAGDVIDGRYRLELCLGIGANGAVWRAEHLGLGAPVAIKVMATSVLEDRASAERFMREAQAAAALRGANVVQTLDFGVANGQPYVVMELIAGRTLAEALAEGPCEPERATEILRDVGRALARAHRRGIVHKRLTPANVMLLPARREIAKVVDFVGGFAATDPTRLTTASFYASPEQARGLQRIDARSDLWALALIAYECLVGARAIAADDHGALMMAICVDPLPIPSHVGAVPPGFDDWFATATHRAIDKRFQEATELLDGLMVVLGRYRDSPPSRHPLEATTAEHRSRTAPEMRRGAVPGQPATEPDALDSGPGAMAPLTQREPTPSERANGLESTLVIPRGAPAPTGPTARQVPVLETPADGTPAPAPTLVDAVGGSSSPGYEPPSSSGAPPSSSHREARSDPRRSSSQPPAKHPSQRPSQPPTGLRPTPRHPTSTSDTGEGPLVVVLSAARDQRDNAVEVLAALGHNNVMDAASTDDALVVLRERPVALLLVDAATPGSDALMRYKRAEARLRSVPLIALVPRHRIRPVSQELHLGTDELIGHPYDPGELAIRIEAALRRRRLQRELDNQLRNLDHERQERDHYLSALMPGAAALELKLTGSVRPRGMHVAVLAYRPAAFEEVCEEQGPAAALAGMEPLIAAFEVIVARHALEHLGVQGGTWMAACGLFGPVDHAVLRAVDCAHDLQRSAQSWPSGLSAVVHHGHVVAGLASRDRGHYDVWGAGLRIAATAVQRAPYGQVMITDAAWNESRGALTRHGSALACSADGAQLPLHAVGRPGRIDV